MAKRRSISAGASPIRTILVFGYAFASCSTASRYAASCFRHIRNSASGASGETAIYSVMPARSGKDKITGSTPRLSSSVCRWEKRNLESGVCEEQIKIFTSIFPKRSGRRGRSPAATCVTYSVLSQECSAPQKGTNMSWESPIVNTSPCCSSTVSVTTQSLR